MKYIRQSCEFIPEYYTIDDMYMHIEKIARTCYKSTSEYTVESAKKFVNRMIESGHLSMLEHGSVYLYVKDVYKLDSKDKSIMYYLRKDPYTITTINRETNERYITTNLRVLFENFKDDYKRILDAYYKYVPGCHQKRISYKLITCRQISHEFVRHRKFSFAQESTRYCNYSKDKFGKELTFIESEVSDEEMDTMHPALELIEKQYMKMIEDGKQPQKAALILPNLLKTELVMTGTIDDWMHFFDLRLLGNTGKPHPLAQDIAYKIINNMAENGVFLDNNPLTSTIENEEK